MVGTSDCDERWLILLQVRFPKIGVALFGTPLTGRLATLDFEVQMRPASAAPLLAQQAKAISHFHDTAKDNIFVELFQVAIAIVPPPRIL